MPRNKTIKPKAIKTATAIDKLTVKQEKFCLHYAQHGDASAAYRHAYNAEKMKPETVHVKACELLKHGKVSVRIAELQAKVKKIAEDRYLVSQERIVAELAKIGFANSEDYFEWGQGGVIIKDSKLLTTAERSVVAEISETKTQHGGSIRIKLSDKQGALEKLGRSIGMFKDRVEHTGKDGKDLVGEMDNLELARYLAFLWGSAAKEKLAAMQASEMAQG